MLELEHLKYLEPLLKGLTTSNKKLLGAPGIAFRSKDAIEGPFPFVFGTSWDTCLLRCAPVKNSLALRHVSHGLVRAFHRGTAPVSPHGAKSEGHLNG